MTVDEVDRAVERVQANAHEGARVQVPQAFVYRYTGAESADTFADRISRCYELALRAQLTFANHGWRTALVHGSIGPQHNPHAWVEWRSDSGERYVWDPILDGIVLGRTYISDYYAITWNRYGPKESTHLSEHSNGPWGARDCRRAITRIRAMIKAGGDPVAGEKRIQEIMDDNRIKETRDA